MGLDLVVARAEPVAIEAVLERLAAAGLRASILMVDGQLHPPGAPVTGAWRDVRLKLDAGTVSLKRRDGAVAVVVFGNADAALQAAQAAVADAIKEA